MSAANVGYSWFSFRGEQLFGDVDVDDDVDLHVDDDDNDEDGVEEEVHKWALLVSYTHNHHHFPPPIIFSKCSHFSFLLTNQR